MGFIIAVELLAYYLFSIIVLVVLYEYKPKNVTVVGLSVLIYGAITVGCGILFFESSFIFIVPALVYHIVSLKLLFKSARLMSLLAHLVLVYSVNISLSSVIFMLINAPYDLNKREFVSMLVMLGLVAASLVYAFFKRTKIGNPLAYIPLHIKRLTMCSVILSAFIVHLISDYNTFESIAKYNTVLRVMLTLLMICIGAAFPLMIASYISKEIHREQLANFQKQIEAQSEHYKTLSGSNEDMRRFRHDYKNMRIAVRRLIEENKIQEAIALLESFDTPSENTDRYLFKYDTGNGIADALLADKQYIASQTDTVINFEGAIPQDKVSPADLCIVLGNTLDNAIEASARLPDGQTKTINVVCKQAGGFLFFKVTNSVTENVKISGSLLPTTKEDKRSHGLGLYSLNKTVGKYNGSLNMSCEDNLFCTEIELEIGA